MSARALLVSTANPYPVVRDGCERLVHDYVDAVLDDRDMYFLHAAPDWQPSALLHEGRVIDANVDLDGLLSYDFAFVVFIGFRDTSFTRELASRRPSFCLTDTFPHPDVPLSAFRGIMSHRNSDDTADILLVGGSYDDAVFYPARRGEDFVLAVGRIHPDKGQLELVAGYREAIFDPYGLPLHLVGGATDLDYYAEVRKYIDGEAVISTIADLDAPQAPGSWRSAHELAALGNRARLFVSGSPKESFSLAMIESMACGTTCVVNGDYWGFAEHDLRPRVHGNIAGKRGSIVDVAADALRHDVRIDASQWARRYALRELRGTVSRFIDERI